MQTRPEANEIILINSHDGASSYQMLAGMFRFVCCNGLVVGEVVDDIRIPHKGNIQGEVIEGAFRVLDEFEAVNEHTEAMKALQLAARGDRLRDRRPGAALRRARRGGNRGHKPAPVTAEQLIEARRPEDIGHSLWTTFQRVQENVIRGGQPAVAPRAPAADQAGGQHRPRREPQPCAVDARRGDAQAEGLTGAR